MRPMLYLPLLILISITFGNCKKEDPKPNLNLNGPYLGQTPPGNIPKVFAPGIISIPNHTEFSLSFSHDGNEVYFYRYGTNMPAKIYYSKSVDETWSELKELSISKGYEGYEPHVTMDNKTLYFFWKKSTKEGIYSSTRNTNGEWDTPFYFGSNMMYFTSSSSGVLYTTELTTTRPYLAKVKFQNGSFAGFERLNIKAPANSYTAHAAIAPDESYPLFDIAGGEHMMITFKQEDGSWGDPIDLTTKGFPKAAGGPYISPDGKYLFYYFNGDIYWVSTNFINELR